jgi:hypothetical protein
VPGVEPEQRQQWRLHCRSMAEATYAMADQTDEPEMIEAYLALAAKWLRLAEEDRGVLG